MVFSHGTMHGRRPDSNVALCDGNIDSTFQLTLFRKCAVAGDLLAIARRADDSLLAIVAKSGTTIERQIMWLFGF